MSASDIKERLTHVFGNVACVRSGNNHFAATLPFIYALDSDTNFFNSLKSAFGAKSKFKPRPIFADGKTEEECFEKLFYNAVESADPEAYIDLLDLYRYRPKSGQDVNILKINHAYKSVQHDEKVHDHKSIQLIDFEIISFAPDLSCYSVMDFEENHVHLLAR
jgi:hypothetical protein